jgi:Flp pilus assembly protein protease CpaA
MNYILNTLTILSLIFLVIQDFRQRLVFAWLIVLIMLLVGYKMFDRVGIREAAVFFLMNTALIAIQLAGIVTYFSLRNKKFTNIINTYIGAGDLFFFAVIAVAFSPLNMLAFYGSSLFLTLVTFIIYRNIKKNTRPEMPLAGGMALMLSVLLIIQIINPSLDLYNDQLLMNFIGI